LTQQVAKNLFLCPAELGSQGLEAYFTVLWKPLEQGTHMEIYF